MAGSRYPNIDKLSGKNYYNGYGGGKVWRIMKGAKYFTAAPTEARGYTEPHLSFRALKLSEVSERLVAMDEPTHKENPTEGERTFATYAAWKRAVKALDPKAQYYGDKDIGGAFGIGEWDGGEGVIYSKETRVKILKLDPTMAAPGKVRKIARGKNPAARKIIKRKTATRAAPTDHIIIAKLKTNLKKYAAKKSIGGVHETLYFDGYAWTTDAKKAARWRDLEQAKKEAHRVANSARLSDANRNIFVRVD